MSKLRFTLWIITILGAIDWLFVALWQIEVVTVALGSWPFLRIMVHLIIGISGILCLIDMIRRRCIP